MSRCDKKLSTDLTNHLDIRKLQAEMDQLDHDICSLLLKRYSLSQTIQGLKASKGLPAYDPAREREILLRLKRDYSEIPDKVLEGLYQQILNWMRKV